MKMWVLIDETCKTAKFSNTAFHIRILMLCCFVSKLNSSRFPLFEGYFSLVLVYLGIYEDDDASRNIRLQR